MLLQVRRPLAVKESARPCELLAHRSRPDLRRQRFAQRALELRALHRTQPGSDPVDYLVEVRPGGGFPVVELLPALNDHRPFDAADTNDPLELRKDLGYPV